MSRHRLPRMLHPGAWWLWASALAVAASRTTNPLLLAAIVAVTGYVVAARRPATPWSASYGMFLKVGLLAIAIRVALFAVLGGEPDIHVLVRLPVVPLRTGSPACASVARSPSKGCWPRPTTGCGSGGHLLLHRGGELPDQPTAARADLCPARCTGRRRHHGRAGRLRAATTIEAVGRLRSRRLRGRTERGLRRIRGLAIPVLEGALEQFVDLAAAMDARGFGRRGSTSAGSAMPPPA